MSARHGEDTCAARQAEAAVTDGGMGTGGQVMTTPADDWIDRLLVDDAASGPAIADDGFTNSVMGALPPAATPARHRWIIVTMTILACVVGLGVLSGGEELTLLLSGLAQSRVVSLGN